MRRASSSANSIASAPRQVASRVMPRHHMRLHMQERHQVAGAAVKRSQCSASSSAETRLAEQLRHLAKQSKPAPEANANNAEVLQERLSKAGLNLQPSQHDAAASLVAQQLRASSASSTSMASSELGVLGQSLAKTGGTATGTAAATTVPTQMSRFDTVMHYFTHLLAFGGGAFAGFCFSPSLQRVWYEKNIEGMAASKDNLNRARKLQQLGMLKSSIKIDDFLAFSGLRSLSQTSGYQSQHDAMISAGLLEQLRTVNQRGHNVPVANRMLSWNVLADLVYFGSHATIEQVLAKFPVEEWIREARFAISLAALEQENEGARLLRQSAQHALRGLFALTQRDDFVSIATRPDVIQLFVDMTKATVAEFERTDALDHNQTSTRSIQALASISMTDPGLAALKRTDVSALVESLDELSGFPILDSSWLLRSHCVLLQLSQGIPDSERLHLSDLAREVLLDIDASSNGDDGLSYVFGHQVPTYHIADSFEGMQLSTVLALSVSLFDSAMVFFLTRASPSKSLVKFGRFAATPLLRALVVVPFLFAAAEVVDWAVREFALRNDQDLYSSQSSAALRLGSYSAMTAAIAALGTGAGLTWPVLFAFFWHWDRRKAQQLKYRDRMRF